MVQMNLMKYFFNETYKTQFDVKLWGDWDILKFDVSVGKLTFKSIDSWDVVFLVCCNFFSFSLILFFSSFF